MPLTQKQEEALFRAAVEMPADKRAAFLMAMCEDDADLRRRLEALLAAQDKPELASSPGEPRPRGTIKLEIEDAPDEAIGQTLGHYKLLEKVGEGGCGVVYVADQTEPVRRRVALKVIKLGMDTKAVVVRFEAERQALAMMDHPNIAKVLDAGATGQGRPFFVMELVRGIRITDYCDKNNLTTKERIDLFIKVCQAIQHAHQKGIIHRDIKPSNILVTLHDGAPVPKVIDFGIAKATEGRLTDNTVYTQLHQFIGTPAYMSPEQAEMSGLDIDTRSDIYSLGVLLYELLAGSTPFDANELMASGIDMMRKTIREKEPPRPSTKLATLKGEELTTTAKRRSVETSRLANLLRGDLDWIVMKCLEKDRTRRYETANGLAADLKRHLNDEPVVARPPSAAYRFQKAFRRNKLVFAAGTAVFVVLCLGVIATTLQSVRATHAKHEALSARQEALTNEKKAVGAQANEAKLREQAQADEFAARQRAYASDMSVAQQALDGNNLGRTLELLNRQRPSPGQKDLRGWEWRYLWQQTRSDALFTLCQQPSEINSLAVSPDGFLMAISPYHRGGVSVWDVRTRQELYRLAKDGILSRAAFSPTGPLLAFATAAPDSGEFTLRLWNTATRQSIAEFSLDGACDGLVFSRDGRVLLTSVQSGHRTLWRMPDGTKLASYPSPSGSMLVGTGFAANGDLSLAAGSIGQGRINVMDLHNGRSIWTNTVAEVFVTALAFSPDGKTLASAGGFAESDIRLWDAATGKETGRLKGHGSWVSSLVFSPDGTKLFSGSADYTIRVWDMATEQCLNVLRGHLNEVWRLALMPDGKTLASGAKDGAVCFWDTSVVHPRQPYLSIPGSFVSWCFASDSRSILTLDRQSKVARWTGRDFEQKEPLLDLGEAVSAETDYFLWSQDARLLAVGSPKAALVIWDLTRRELCRQWTNTAPGVLPDAFTADGNKLITDNKFQKGRAFHEWDLATGREIQSWPVPPSSSGGLAVSPDDRSFMAVGYEGDAIIRNLAEESLTRTNLDFLEGSFASYSPDGKVIVIVSHLGLAGIWNAATWRREATLGGFFNGADSVCFSMDSKRLAVGSGAKEAIKLFDTESWQEVQTLEAQGYGNVMAFSPDGSAIGWQNMTGDLYIWRAPSWAEINSAEAKDPPSPGYSGRQE